MFKVSGEFIRDDLFEFDEVHAWPRLVHQCAKKFLRTVEQDRIVSASNVLDRRKRNLINLGIPLQFVLKPRAPFLSRHEHRVGVNKKCQSGF